MVNLPLRTALWNGFTRGLALGLIGGLVAGGVEGWILVRDAPVMRAALIEAAGYAVLIDTLAGAGVAAILSALLVALLAVCRVRLPSSTLGALHVSVCAGSLLFLMGLVWAYRANGADIDVGIPAGTVLALLVLAISLGGSAFIASRSFAASLVDAPRRIATFGVVGSVLFALALPVQVFIEAQQHMAAAPDSTKLQPLDPALVNTDLSADLRAGLARAYASADKGTGDKGTRARPNVLLITVDALRADHIGVCGNDWIRTPAIDLLASYSAVSCNTYTEQPQTNPALASLFTGTYPGSHGVRRHMVDRLSEGFDTLAKVLQRNGYNTAGIIPWTSLEPAFSGFQQGFQTYEAFVMNEPEVLKNPATAALAGIYRRVTEQIALGSAIESMLGMRRGTEAEIDGRADLTGTAAMTWLANNADSSFFLWVHFFDPHYPWTPPEPWDQLYDTDYSGRYDGGMGFVYEMRAGVFNPNPRDVQYLRALYASEVSYADHHIGQVLGYLAKRNLLDNTIIMLTSDHGESLGERGTNWMNGDYWLHGDDLYTPGVQVPLIIYDPRSPRSYQPLTAPTQHIDIMPTVLDLVSLPIPPQVQGRSIVPLLNGTESGLDRVVVTTLADDSQQAVVSGEGWKLITKKNPASVELYNLAADTEERVNLASVHPDRVASLTRQLDALASSNLNAVAARPIDDRSDGTSANIP